MFFRATGTVDVPRRSPATSDETGAVTAGGVLSEGGGTSPSFSARMRAYDACNVARGSVPADAADLRLA